MTKHHQNSARGWWETLRRSDAAGNLRAMAVTGFISMSLLSVMYGVTLHRAAEQRAQHQAELQQEARIDANAQRPTT